MWAHASKQMRPAGRNTGNSRRHLPGLWPVLARNSVRRTPRREEGKKQTGQGAPPWPVGYLQLGICLGSYRIARLRRRRAVPAIPTSVVANSIRAPGSGTGAGGS